MMDVWGRLYNGSLFINDLLPLARAITGTKNYTLGVIHADDRRLTGFDGKEPSKVMDAVFIYEFSFDCLLPSETKKRLSPALVS